MTATLERPALHMRTLTDHELADAYHAGLVPLAEAAAECDRRDAHARRSNAARAAARRRYSDWHDAAHAQYLAADAYTRGNLLSAAGRRACIADPMRLWRGSADTARRYASEELREFWDYQVPRLSPGEYARQLSASARAELEAAELEQPGAPSPAPRASVGLVTPAAARVEPARVELATWPASEAPRAALHMAPSPAAIPAAPPGRPVGSITRYARALGTLADHAEAAAVRLAAARATIERKAS